MATVPYRPSNGLEGEGFMERFCGRCQKDEAGRREDWANACPIVANALAYPLGDPKFPEEWVRDEGDPCGDSARCTAFVQVVP